MKSFIIKAKVKTKSNFRKMNGQWFRVVELSGRRVTVETVDLSAGRKINVDFVLEEIVEFKSELV